MVVAHQCFVNNIVSSHVEKNRLEEELGWISAITQSRFHSLWGSEEKASPLSVPSDLYLDSLVGGFHHGLRYGSNFALFPKGCLVDLWNFCKVWTLKSCPKALLLICFHWGGGTHEAHVCATTFHCSVFSCVIGVRGCMGDTWVTVHNSGEERRSFPAQIVPGCKILNLENRKCGKEKGVYCSFKFRVKSDF